MAAGIVMPPVFGCRHEAAGDGAAGGRAGVRIKASYLWCAGGTFFGAGYDRLVGGGPAAWWFFMAIGLGLYLWAAAISEPAA